MALEDELIGQEAANALVKWEEFAANGVGDIITAAVSQFGYSAQALLTSQISVTEFIGSTLAQVFNVGTAIAGGAFQLLSGRRPTVRRRGLNVRELPPTPALPYPQKVEQAEPVAVPYLAHQPDQAARTGKKDRNET